MQSSFIYFSQTSARRHQASATDLFLCSVLSIVTLQVPVRPLLVRKCAKISVFSVKIAKTFFQRLYQNLGEPLITIAIFRFLPKQRGQLLLLYKRYRSKITL